MQRKRELNDVSQFNAASEALHRFQMQGRLLFNAALVEQGQSEVTTTLPTPRFAHQSNFEKLGGFAKKGYFHTLGNDKYVTDRLFERNKGDVSLSGERKILQKFINNHKKSQGVFVSK